MVSIKSCCFICRLLLHGYIYNILHVYGTDGVTKTDEFSENFHGGECRGGGIFNPNFYVAYFGPLNRAFLARN